MNDTETLLKTCAGWQAHGAPFTFCLATHITGGTLRETGAMMAVRGDAAAGASTAGYISAGCVDADIVFQAKIALAENKPRSIAYGQGSPFKDIVLPCGGRIELTLIPNPDPAALAALAQRLGQRRPGGLYIEHNQIGFFEADSAPPAQARFTHIYTPPLRLRIAGRGEILVQLARLARAAGFDGLVQSPDDLSNTDLAGFAYQTLTNPARPPKGVDDARTALALVFHDHDWETALLQSALAGPAFYIGAMGSARTHTARLNRLREQGTSEGQFARIHGPIGVIPRLRDARLLSLSILTEVIQAARRSSLV